MALNTIPYINPYITGNPVHGDLSFFGRTDILAQMEQILAAPGQNAALLFGQRRIGKTSILLQLQHSLPSNQYTVIYQDLQDKARQPMGELLSELAIEIADKLDLNEPKLLFDDQGRVFQKEFLPQVYQALPSEKQRLVLLFDEFDVLDVIQRERLPVNAAGNQLFSTLRRWMREELGLAFIFALGRNLDDLDNDFLSTFKGSQTVQTSILSKADTIALVTAPNCLRYADEAIEIIYALTNGHPFFTQLLCSLCFDLVYTQGKFEENSFPLPTINAKDVEVLIPTIFSRSENIFLWIWDGLPPVEKLTASALAELLMDDKVTATNEQIENIIKHSSKRLIIRDLEVSPEKLVKWQLIQKRNNGYQFLVPLLHRWIRLKKPLADVHDEFDRLHPRSNYYFQLAKLDYEENKLDDAVLNLERSLNLYPDHLQASLLMGDIYLEQNEVDEAVNSYEKAYTIAPGQSRRKLVNGLIRQVESLSEAWDITLINTLRLYSRIRVLDPTTNQVQERVNNFVVKKIDAWLNELAQANDSNTLRQASELLYNLIEEKIWEAQAKNLLAITLLRLAETLEKIDTGLLDALKIYYRFRDTNPNNNFIQERINNLSIRIEGWLSKLAEKEQFSDLRRTSELLVDLTKDLIWREKATEFEDNKKITMAYEMVEKEIRSGQIALETIQAFERAYNEAPQYLQKKSIEHILNVVDKSLVEDETLLVKLKIYQWIKAKSFNVNDLEKQIKVMEDRIDIWLRSLAEKERFSDLRGASEFLVDLTKNKNWSQKAKMLEDEKLTKVAYKRVQTQVELGLFATAIQSLEGLSRQYPIISNQNENQLRYVKRQQLVHQIRKWTGRTLIVVIPALINYMIGIMFNNLLEIKLFPITFLPEGPAIQVFVPEVPIFLTILSIIIALRFVDKGERERKNKNDERYFVSYFFRSLGFVFVFCLLYFIPIGFALFVWTQTSTTFLFPIFYIGIGISIILLFRQRFIWLVKALWFLPTKFAQTLSYLLAKSIDLLLYLEKLNSSNSTLESDTDWWDENQTKHGSQFK